MKLITEAIEEVQVIAEEDGGSKKNLFIEGVFLQAGIKNRNGRVYPKHIMDKEVSRYMKEHVQRGNAYGELGHPSGPTINPERISHLIVSLREDGNNYIGKAKILDTDMGRIAKGIMEGGGTLAVSSRGIGSLKRVGDAMQVCEDFMLSTAADIVINPSAPDAYVDGIMEGVEWIWEGSVLREKKLSEIKDEINEAVRSRQLDEAAILRTWEKFVNAIVSTSKS